MLEVLPCPRVLVWDLESWYLPILVANYDEEAHAK